MKSVVLTLTMLLHAYADLWYPKDITFGTCSNDPTQRPSTFTEVNLTLFETGEQCCEYWWDTFLAKKLHIMFFLSNSYVMFYVPSAAGTLGKTMTGASLLQLISTDKEMVAVVTLRQSFSTIPRIWRLAFVITMFLKGLILSLIWDTHYFLRLRIVASIGKWNSY